MLMNSLIILSTIFMFLKHPLSMGFLLIIQTIIIAMITGMMKNSFLFSYILLITMLSGALVLFIYMASIASNEKFFFSMKTLSLTGILILMFMWPDQIISNQFKYQSKIINFQEYPQVSEIFELFNNQLFITLMLVMYLFFTMIAVSFIVNIQEGPMRLKS